MRATIECQDGQPSHLHISKGGEAVKLTPGESTLAARLLLDLREARSKADEQPDGNQA